MYLMLYLSTNEANHDDSEQFTRERRVLREIINKHQKQVAIWHMLRSKDTLGSPWLLSQQIVFEGEEEGHSEVG